MRMSFDADNIDTPTNTASDTTLVFNIGHGMTYTDTIDYGRYNKQLGISEFEFNSALATELARHLPANRVHFVYQDISGYGGLPERINTLAPTWVISMYLAPVWHTSWGINTYYYHGSPRGKELAELVQRHLVAHLRLPDRGAQPYHRAHPFGLLLSGTDAPCVVAEPYIPRNVQTFSARELLGLMTKAYLGVAHNLLVI